MPKIPTSPLQIPGYQPPSFEEVQLQALSAISQQLAVLLKLTECLLRATLGYDEEEIRQATGLVLVNDREETDDAAEGTPQDGEAGSGA